MNKKTTILVICSIIFVAYLFIDTSIIIYKGYQIFGNEKCHSNHFNEPGFTAITHWKCKICGKDGGECPTTNTPRLCDRCSYLTSRCYNCGKFKSIIK